MCSSDLKEMAEMVKAALEGDMARADELDRRLQPFFEAEFIETNPIPIKAALAMQGKIKEAYRLPMCRIDPQNREKLKEVMIKMGLL